MKITCWVHREGSMPPKRVRPAGSQPAQPARVSTRLQKRHGPKPRTTEQQRLAAYTEFVRQLSDLELQQVHQGGWDALDPAARRQAVHATVLIIQASGPQGLMAGNPQLSGIKPQCARGFVRRWVKHGLLSLGGKLDATTPALFGDNLK
jgi:hypothetical protein